MPYYPSRDHWEARPAAALGLAPEHRAAAIEYHQAHETRRRRHFISAPGRDIGVADEPPAPGDVLDPAEPRVGPNGLVIRGGRIAAEWGNTERVDMTFSVAQRYLSVLVEG
jgi:hypothetical protein